MRNLAEAERLKIGEIVKVIIDKLNITQSELALAVGASLGTIKNILKGQAATYDVITNTLNFLAISTPLRKDYKVPLEPELRQKIKSHHVLNKISDSQKLLEKRPTFLVIISDRLIPGGFFKNGKTSADVLNVLKEEYNIITISSVLSKELKKSVGLGILAIVDEQSKRFEYIQKS